MTDALFAWLDIDGFSFLNSNSFVGKDVGMMSVFYAVITWKINILNRRLRSWKKKILQESIGDYQTTLLQVRTYRKTGCSVPIFAVGECSYSFIALTFLAESLRISPNHFKRTILPGDNSFSF